MSPSSGPMSYNQTGVVTSPVSTPYNGFMQPVSYAVEQPAVTMVQQQQAVTMVEQPVQMVQSPPPPQSVVTRVEMMPAPPPEIIERVVEVEVIKEIPVDRIVEVPVDRVVDRFVEVNVERIVEKIKEVQVEHVVVKDVPVEVERVVEKVIVKEVPVPVEKIVEKIVEVPVEKIVYQDRIVYQDQVVYQDRVVEVPVERVVHYNAPREGPSVATGQAYVVGMREVGGMYSSQRQAVSSRQVGLGLRLRKNEQQQTCIKEIFSGYAASRSGRLNPGDVILSIDGRSIEGMDLENIKNLTIGEEGTNCTLSILRQGQKFDATFQRCHPELAANDPGSAEVYRSLSRSSYHGEQRAYYNNQ